VVEAAGRGAHGAVFRALRVGQEHASGTRHPYLAMQWIDGVPLYEWARLYHPTSQQMLRLLAQLSLALQSLHAQDAMHRDVKGDNTLVRRSDSRLFLTDFGSSIYPGGTPLTPPPLPPGTPAYRSPEAWLFAALAQKAGYKDAREYFSKTLADLSQSALTMYGTEATYFSEAVATRFGITCLYLLLTYKTAANLKLNHEEPGGTLIEVPAQHGEVTAKPFNDCSVEDMRRAIRHKRKPSASTPVLVEHVALADQYQEAVTNRFPHGVVILVEVRNQKGDSVLDIKGIPVEQVSLLVGALMDQLPAAPVLLLPEQQVPRVTPAATVS
jgi:hypothetical protein